MILLVRPQQSLPNSLAYFQQHGISCDGLAVQTIDVNPTLTKPLNSDIAAFIQNDRKESEFLFDAAIVTSRFAADELIQQLKLNNCLLSQFAQQIVAVGQTTAEHLKCFASDLSIVTPQRQDSEGVLLLKQFQRVEQKRIALIKGVGGRELLATTLISRGALISEYSIYQRLKLELDLTTYLERSENIDLVVVTSGEAASILLSDDSGHILKQKPWLVISKRVAKLVEQSGVSSVYISAGASDSALVKCIQEIME